MNKCPILLLFVFMVTACSPEGEHAPLPSEPDAITLAPGTPSVKEFPAMGGLWELRFSATKAWSVVPADPVHAEWYRIEPAEGDDGNGTVKVTVLPNITTEKRSAEIIIIQGEVAAFDIQPGFDLIFNCANGSSRKHGGRKLYGACFGVRCVDTNCLSCD